jgi:hypothetical protein
MSTTQRTRPDSGSCSALTAHRYAGFVHTLSPLIAHPYTGLVHPPLRRDAVRAPVFTAPRAVTTVSAGHVGVITRSGAVVPGQ